MKVNNFLFMLAKLSKIEKMYVLLLESTILTSNLNWKHDIYV